MQKSKTRLLMKQGSILAYSLIVVSVMIVIATSISAVTVIEKKGAVSTDSSVQAYQTADSGVQLAIKKINKAISENTDNPSIGSVFTDCSGPLSTSKGEIFDGAEYKLSFFSDEEGNTQIGCSATIDQIQNIKSVGEYKDTVRAVQVSIAGPCPNCNEECNYNGDTYDTILIGTQCWFAENLRTNKKPNGELLTLGTDYYCYADGPNNDPDCATSTSGKTDADGDKYGVLYNWATAMNLPAACNDYATGSSDCLNIIPATAKWQGICPRGWHIPNSGEWSTLTNSLNDFPPLNFGIIFAGYYNSNGIPGPSRFALRDTDGFFLYSDEIGANNYLYLRLQSISPTPSQNLFSKSVGSSVRCLKNN